MSVEFIKVIQGIEIRTNILPYNDYFSFLLSDIKDFNSFIIERISKQYYIDLNIARKPIIHVSESDFGAIYKYYSNNREEYKAKEMNTIDDLFYGMEI